MQTTQEAFLTSLGSGKSLLSHEHCLKVDWKVVKLEHRV